MSNRNLESNFNSSSRYPVMGGVFVVALLLVVSRLFYWQVIRGEDLQVSAQQQYRQLKATEGERGSILTADGQLLVGNKPVFRLFAQPHLFDKSPTELAEILLPIIAADDPQALAASSAADLKTITENIKISMLGRLGQTDKKWVNVMNGLSEETQQKISQLEIKGLGFEKYQTRFYPEGSMAAHVVGFVGKTEDGEPQGYFGVEGALDEELSPRRVLAASERDAFGKQLFGTVSNSDSLGGRDVYLTIDRQAQHLAEEALKKGMERYQAKAGEVLIMEPSTGRILAMAAWPSYDPATFNTYEAELYKNPILTHVYEPGSTFKTLTVSAGIDASVITPDTQCPNCDQPRQISGYTIRTWNDQYNPLITITDALAKSDNTAMMFIVDQLGKDTFVDYVQRFGIGQKTYIELQEDRSTPFPSKWGPVELATTSFGQGISTTSLQLVKAVSAIANGGIMMQPMIVDKVHDPSTGEDIVTNPKVVGQVVKPDTASQVSRMMVTAASSGEAKWIASRTHQVAGKTGTSQVAENGSYNPDKTIASFIGFAPPDKPRFVMLVKLVEPGSSPWAAETAAPLWYTIADKLYLLLGMPPDISSATEHAN